MRRVGAERTLPGDELVEPGGGGVERVGDCVEFAHPGPWRAGGEVALAELSGGGGQAVERGDQAAGEDQRGEHGERDQPGGAGGEQPPGARGPRAAASVFGRWARTAPATRSDSTQRHGDDQPTARGAVGGRPVRSVARTTASPVAGPRPSSRCPAGHRRPGRPGSAGSSTGSTGPG